jgi:hypothetical protein
MFIYSAEFIVIHQHELPSELPINYNHSIPVYLLTSPAIYVLFNNRKLRMKIGKIIHAFANERNKAKNDFPRKMGIGDPTFFFKHPPSPTR